ncbi:alpha/beta hydrolase [Bradyrhizobium cosmicum]|uniref:alpha/beta hydrolase n=1 Tax=Bradyrhizobium cosmicum TaxID=1404864 RepID=UPI0028EFC4BC|nr:alpha/beta hydrolase [Bradyrhizobium cosmicum]
MTFLKWIAIVLASGYLAGLLLLYAKQRDMLFPIPTTERRAPATAGFPQAEEHALTTSDGEKVIVWHVPAKPGRPVVLFFPGNGDFLAGRVNRFKGIIADGTGLVALSYRGYAGSTGAPSEQGLLQDAAAAYAFATERYDPQRIVAWGFSLGTGVAVAIASEHPVGKLILEAPYTSTVDIAASLFRFVPIRLLMRDPFHSDERIARVTAPLLIMHGTSDTAIPIAFGERLFTMAREPKKLMRFPGGGHENLDDFGALETARQFINSP